MSIEAFHPFGIEDKLEKGMREVALFHSSEILN
jgi:hypothetical protein